MQGRHSVLPHSTNKWS